MLRPLFKDYYCELLGPTESVRFFSAIEERAKLNKKDQIRSIRVNTLRCSKTELRTWFESQGYQVVDSLYCVDGLDITGSGQEWALKLPYHSGYTYPQDAASMFAVEVLNPQPGETVLDLTAAPGGKTTHMAQRMKNTGILFANDLDTRRIKALKSNLSRLGVLNTYVTRLTASKMADLYPETFDRILLDPSCSGEGLFVNSEGQPEYWNKKALKHFSALQFGLLRDAFRMLKPGGRLLYSTCTLNNIENDGVVNDFLAKIPEAKIENNILQELKTRGITVPEQIEDLKGLRFWPHKTNTKGFFCIALTKIRSQNLTPVRFARERREHTLQVLRSHERLSYDSFLIHHFGVDADVLKDFDWVPFEHHLYLVHHSLKDITPPPGFALTLPALKTYGQDHQKSSDMKLSHEGAVFFAPLVRLHTAELSKEQMENAMRNQPVHVEGLDEGMYLAKYKQFAIGLLKIGVHRTELLIPKMA